jgi:short-subunit dehydrogenase
MAVNYASPVRLTLALLPRMIERGHGAILTISSVAARFGPPREAAYSASKAALSAFMESLAVDLDGTDIRIHLVNPGIIDTELFHLPDNEQSLADLEALPVETLVDAVKKQLQDNTFEIYVPEWFTDIVAGRYANLGPFIEGSKDYTRERVKQMEAE